METVLHSESRRRYSWWWDSHISPKNSKWLQDNLTDIDVKVKTMIKLIEEDADSFARRAEMYYKKRPELMKLVEEFYRAYRALAERYDHATGELRHAQKTLAAAFPNQVPFPFIDDPQGLNGDDFGPTKGLKQLDEMLVALASSKLSEENENQDLEDRASKAENQIEMLKKVLEDLQTEKDRVLHLYDESVEKLAILERELDGALMTSRGMGEEARLAKAEVEKLKDALSRLERERDDVVLNLNEYRDRISKLEADLYKALKDEEGLTGRAIKAEAKAQYLVDEISNLKVKNNGVYSDYQRCVEQVSELQQQLSLTQEKSDLINERADRAENEVRALNKALAEASEDKEGIASRYEHCLEKISKLERELSGARDDIQCLNGAIELKSEKLKGVEEKCDLLELSNHALQLEAGNLENKITTKNEELSKKDEEIERVQFSLQNEHSKFVQAEATLKTLRNLQSQAQREQKALALELKNGIKIIKEMEENKYELEEEILQVKDENRNLNECNSSSKVAMENLESEVLKLKEIKERLEREVELQMSQTNNLQKEIYNLNEDMEGLSMRYKNVIEQVESVGLKPENIENTVKDLMERNSELRHLCDKERDEKQNFIKKLDNMKQFLERNAILEDFVAALNGELEKSKEKVKALLGEKSYLVDEKAVILSHLQAISESMEKLLERNTLLENSLSGANIELISLREKAKCLEELCKSLSIDRSNLLNETSNLVFQLGNVEQRLENLEKRFSQLEVSYSCLEKEKESALSQVIELKICLDTEKQERANFMLSSETRLTLLEDHVQLLQEESKSRKEEFEEELDRSVNAQFEIFLLQRFIQDLEQNNLSVLLECQKHVEASKLSDKVISELESENLEQQVETEVLLDDIEKLRIGVHQLFKALEIGPDQMLVDKMENGYFNFDWAVKNIEELKLSLSNYKDDKDQLSIENLVILTLVGQLKVEASELLLERNKLQYNVKMTSEQLVGEKKEKNNIIEINRQLKSDIQLRDQLTDDLRTKIERLGNEERDMKRAYSKLHDEYSRKVEENSSLLNTLLDLKEKNNVVEEESHSILVEALALDSKSIVLKQFGDDRIEEVKSLFQDLQKLEGQRSDFQIEVGGLKSELDIKESENLLLKKCVKKLGKELDEVRNYNTQLIREFSYEKSLSNQKEVELLMVTEKLKAKEEINLQLCKTAEKLERKNQENELALETSEKQNFDMSQENNNQKNEIENLLEEAKQCKVREDKLYLELKEINNEFQMFEAEAETFYFDLQISTVREVLLENKANELNFVCEKVENDRDSKMAEIELMKQRVVLLESEICGLKDQLSAYDPVIDTLRDNVMSLEKKILSQQQLNIADICKFEEIESHINLHEKISKEVVEDDKHLVPNGVSELQQLQNRIKEVEKVVTEEMKRRGRLKNSKSNKKLESAMREIKDLKANTSLRFDDKVLPETEPGFLKVKNGINLTKDIPLDHILNDSYGVSRRRFQRADDQMLELWETSEDDHSLGRIKTKSIKPINVSRRFENVERSSIDSSMELLIEKELGVDRLEVPTSGTESTQVRNKRKILERLDSDAQKLKSLKTAVDGLRRKLELNMTKKKITENVDFEIVKEQLKEVEETIIQLVDVNLKLTKNVEENGAYSDKKASPELEVIGNLRRKRVADQARKVSEKIARLLIEVQKIQYMLLKLEDEKKNKERIQFSKSKTSIILKGFISGRKGISSKRKKPCFGGCFRSTSKGEGRSASDFNHLSYK